MVLVNPKNAHAYLDPGTGSYLTQVIAASLVGVGIFWKTIFRKIKTIIDKINGTPKKSN